MTSSAIDTFLDARGTEPTGQSTDQYLRYLLELNKSQYIEADPEADEVELLNGNETAAEQESGTNDSINYKSTNRTTLTISDASNLDVNDDMDMLNYILQKSELTGGQVPFDPSAQYNMRVIIYASGGTQTDVEIMKLILSVKNEAINQLDNYKNIIKAGDPKVDSPGQIYTQKEIDELVQFWEQQVRNQEKIENDLRAHLGNINTRRELDKFYELYKQQEELLSKGADLPNNLALFKVRLLMQTLITEGSVKAVRKIEKLIDDEYLLKLLSIEIGSSNYHEQVRVYKLNQEIELVNEQLASVYARLNTLREKEESERIELEYKAQHLESRLSSLYGSL